MIGRRGFIGGLSALAAAFGLGFTWPRTRPPLSGPEIPPYEHLSPEDCRTSARSTGGGLLFTPATCAYLGWTAIGRKFVPHRNKNTIVVTKAGELREIYEGGDIPEDAVGYEMLSDARAGMPAAFYLASWLGDLPPGWHCRSILNFDTGRKLPAHPMSCRRDAEEWLLAQWRRRVA